MKIKRKIALYILFCGLSFTLKSQGLLPLVQDNICLDELINVNANALGNPKNLVVTNLGGSPVKEVIVADASASIIKVYGFIPATANFTLQTFINVPGSFGIGKHRAIAAGEFTGDAQTDIVFTNDTAIFVYKNNGSFSFSQLYKILIPTSFIGQEHYLKVDNINNAGADEFYFISSNTSIGPGITVIPFINVTSNIIQESPVTIFKSSGNLFASSLDINIGNVKGDPDGLKDLMITYENVKDSVFFLDNASGPTFLSFNKIPVYLPPPAPFSSPDFTITSSELADVNNDNKLDFIFSGKNVTGNKIVVYAGINSFIITLPLTISVSGINIIDFKIEDINSDAIKDFIGVGNYISTTFSGLALYPGNNTSSYFDSPITVTFTNSTMRPDELVVTDVDQNGINDLVTKPWKANFDKTYLIPNFSYSVSAKATPSVICGTVPSSLSVNLTPTQTLSLNYNWENITTGSLVSSSANFTTNIADEYKILVDFNMYSGNTCTLKSDTVKVVSNIPAITVSSQNTTVCYGDYAITSASGAATYTWISSSVYPIFLGPTCSVQALSSIVYTVTGELTNGCKGTNTVSINLYPLNTDVISASKNPACIGDPISLSMASGVTYTWSSGSNNAIATVTPMTASIYSLVFTDANGCRSTKSITVDVDPKCSPKIYNGITVNGDGNNDFFEIENIEKFTNNSVKIYNRWGKEIFTTVNYDNKNNHWPTSEDLKTIAPSTYFYIINYGDGSEIQKGWVELIKN